MPHFQPSAALPPLRATLFLCHRHLCHSNALSDVACVAAYALLHHPLSLMPSHLNPGLLLPRQLRTRPCLVWLNWRSRWWPCRTMTTWTSCRTTSVSCRWVEEASFSYALGAAGLSGSGFMHTSIRMSIETMLWELTHCLEAVWSFHVHERQQQGTVHSFAAWHCCALCMFRLGPILVYLQIPRDVS